MTNKSAKPMMNMGGFETLFMPIRQSFELGSANSHEFRFTPSYHLDIRNYLLMGVYFTIDGSFHDRAMFAGAGRFEIHMDDRWYYTGEPLGVAMNPQRVGEIDYRIPDGATDLLTPMMIPPKSLISVRVMAPGLASSKLGTLSCYLLGYGYRPVQERKP